MSRDLTTAMATAASAEVIRPVIMVKLELDSATITVHSGVGSFIWNGDTYSGVGHFGSLSEVSESGAIAPNAVTATLTGIPQEYLAETIGGHYQGRPAEVYKALLTEDHELIADPALSFSGYVDYAKIKLGKEVSIAMVINSRLADWNRESGLRWTHECQQQLYPGDMGFEFVGQQADEQLIWGDV